MSILLQKLIFSYSSVESGPLLDIEHWSVAKNEQVFLRGPSGSGKSTLLNILCGLLKAEQGNVSILDKSLGDMSAHQRDQFRATHIGYVFQQFNLIPYLDAIDNIHLAAFFSPSSRSKSQLMSDTKGLLSRLNIKESQWHRPAAKLSVGQQQRVAIARALINQPDILIVDEPTSSLDERNCNAFMSLIFSVLEDHPATLIFVSHDMSLSHYFTRVDLLTDINRAYEHSSIEV